MKRIALLGFVILVVPVLWVSCSRCGKDGPTNIRWTWDKIQMTVTDMPDGISLIKGDTVTTDSAYFSCQMVSKELVINQKTVSSMYSAFACEPVLNMSQENPIIKCLFGIGTFTSMDPPIESSLTLNSYYRVFNWDKDEQRFIDGMSGEDNRNYRRIFGKFLSPHNSKPVRIIMMAIKQNGDTLKGYSEEIVLK